MLKHLRLFFIFASRDYNLQQRTGRNFHQGLKEKREKEKVEKKKEEKLEKPGEQPEEEWSMLSTNTDSHR